MKHLSETSKQSLDETLVLKDTLAKMVGLIEVFEQHRKQDQKSLVAEMKELFHGQTNTFDELKQATKISNSKYSSMDN
jgi:DNA-binding protein H-NS